jgi:hypothetical protein
MSMPTIILYHGTTATSAEHLMRHGWTPNAWRMGSHCGQPRYLYLTNFPENALWYAQEKDDQEVLTVEVPLTSLKVDPEDGIHETVDEELSKPTGLPGSVVLIHSIPPSAFSRYSFTKNLSI